MLKTKLFLQYTDERIFSSRNSFIDTTNSANKKSRIFMTQNSVTEKICIHIINFHKQEQTIAIDALNKKFHLNHDFGNIKIIHFLIHPVHQNKYTRTQEYWFAR